MWIPLWIVCVGLTCQQLELAVPQKFTSKTECEKFALEAAKELQQSADRVGYKCNKVDDI